MATSRDRQLTGSARSIGAHQKAVPDPASFASSSLRSGASQRSAERWTASSSGALLGVAKFGRLAVDEAGQISR